MRKSCCAGLRSSGLAILQESMFGEGENPDRTDSRVECGGRCNGIVAGSPPKTVGNVRDL